MNQGVTALCAVRRLALRVETAPGVALSLIALALLAQVSPLWLPTRDGAAYLSISRSIASGSGFLRFGDPQLHFAPGYPLLVSPAFLLADQPILWISLIHWLLTIAFLGGCYIWLRRQIPEHALLLTVLAVLNVGVLYYFRRTLSEAAFMPVLMWTAVLMDRSLDKRPGPISLIILTCAAVYLCIIRLAGMSLVCGFACMLYRAVHAGKLSAARALFLGAGAVLLPAAAALAFVYYDHALAAYGERGATYFQELMRHHDSIHGQILTGLRLRIQEVGRLLLPGAFKAYGGWLNPAMLLYLPLAAAVAAGWRLLLRQRPSALLFACPFYLALYIAWPHDQGTRFMTPLVPVLWAAAAAFALQSRWRDRFPRVAPWILIASVATSIVYFIADRAEMRRGARFAEIAGRIAAAVPARTSLGFIGPREIGSDSAFASFCALHMDRRCEAIVGDKPQEARRFEYIAVLGAADAPDGFVAIFTRENLTVLQRRR